MKILLAVLIIVIGAGALLGIFAPKDFKLERNIVINTPKDKVYNHLKFLKNHDQWNAWTLKDPNIKRDFQGTDGKVGFVSSWVSSHKDVGSADQEITALIEGQRIETEIRFKEPLEASFNSYLATEVVGANQTKVTMGMSDQMTFPVNAISFFFNEILGQKRKLIKDMDDSLTNLKTLLERK